MSVTRQEIQNGRVLGQGKPKAFAGRNVLDAKTRYTTTCIDQELLVVIYALTQWRCYLQNANQ